MSVQLVHVHKPCAPMQLTRVPPTAPSCSRPPSLLPALQMMAGTVVQHTVMPNPGLPAVGLSMGQVARLLEQARQAAVVCHGYPLCARVCHVSHAPTATPYLPLVCPCYTHHPHYTAQNSPVTLLLPFIAQPRTPQLPLPFIVHPFHTCYTPINL